MEPNFENEDRTRILKTDCENKFTKRILKTKVEKRDSKTKFENKVRKRQLETTFENELNTQMSKTNLKNKFRKQSLKTKVLDVQQQRILQGQKRPPKLQQKGMPEHVFATGNRPREMTQAGLIGPLFGSLNRTPHPVLLHASSGSHLLRHTQSQIAIDQYLHCIAGVQPPRGLHCALADLAPFR